MFPGGVRCLHGQSDCVALRITKVSIQARSVRIYVIKGKTRKGKTRFFIAPILDSIPQTAQPCGEVPRS